jgi:phosphate transport system ATP-binding protein
MEAVEPSEAALRNVMETHGLRVAYSGREVLHGVDLPVARGEVTALVGPSGCGKTTLLRTLNRMSELTPGCVATGRITIDGEDCLRMDPVLLRRRVGMVFQRPNPFPMSIRENVLYGVKAQGGPGPGGKTVERALDTTGAVGGAEASAASATTTPATPAPPKAHAKHAYDEILETSLRRAVIWDEVKDRLDESALALSGGQQQRLCIARSLAVSPEVVLMDEPAGSLDPRSTAKLEESIVAMRGDYTVVIVTHELGQAHRISDSLAVMYAGHILEFGPTKQLFESAQNPAAAEYLAGGLVTLATDDDPAPVAEGVTA